MKLLILLILLIPLPTQAPEAIIEPPVETVKEKIIRMSEEYGVDTEIALRIAECESQFGKYNHNWNGSSAKGVYMFIDKTWNNYCEGDVFSEDDNIKCFMKIYKKNPDWWKCQ